jgi:hypothetical protein
MDIIEIFNLPGLLIELLAGFFFVMLYPFERAFQMIWNCMDAIYSPFAIFFNSLIEMWQILSSGFTDLFLAAGFNSIWILMLMCILGLTVVLRVYKFLSDIEILGFKI